MTYALSTLWFERQRFFAAVLAVTFSTVLICLQFGILLGMFALTSVPIDYANAQIWLAGPAVSSVDVARPIPNRYQNWLLKQPEVIEAETYILGFNYWTRHDGGAELVIIVGSHLHDDSLGAIKNLDADLRAKLTEPNTIVVDESELSKLGLKGIGDIVQIGGKRARLVGTIQGVGSLQGPYVFCSVETARTFLNLSDDQTTYVLARCRTNEEAAAVVKRLNKLPMMSVWTSSGFSYHSQMRWLTKTKAGLALGFAAALGLLVGAVVTRQSLYSATVASIREYAVLRALGIPRWRMALNLVSLAFWVGLIGITLAFPITYGLLQLGIYLNLSILMPWWLVLGSVVVTWTVAILAGLTTLHTLHQVEPMVLLR